MFTLEFDNILEVQEALKILCHFKVDAEVMSQYPETDTLWPLEMVVKGCRGRRKEDVHHARSAFEIEHWKQVGSDSKPVYRCPAI
jgi:hypothetical protein